MFTFYFFEENFIHVYKIMISLSTKIYIYINFIKILILQILVNHSRSSGFFILQLIFAYPFFIINKY